MGLFSKFVPNRAQDSRRVMDVNASIVPRIGSNGLPDMGEVKKQQFASNAVASSDWHKKDAAFQSGASPVPPPPKGM